MITCTHPTVGTLPIKALAAKQAVIVVSWNCMDQLIRFMILTTIARTIMCTRNLCAHCLGQTLNVSRALFFFFLTNWSKLADSEHSKQNFFFLCDMIYYNLINLLLLIGHSYPPLHLQFQVRCYNDCILSCRSL